MTKCTSIGIALILAMAGVIEEARAQSAKDLVGTWQQIKNVNTSADGKTSDAFGEKPAGGVIFTADGHYMLVNMRSDLGKIKAENRMQGTADENKAVVQGAITHYGTYSLSGKTLNFKIEKSTFPNWDGTTQIREIVKFAPEEMTYSFTPSTGGKSEATYQKVK